MSAEELDTLIGEVKELMQKNIDFKYNGAIPSINSFSPGL